MGWFNKGEPLQLDLSVLRSILRKNISLSFFWWAKRAKSKRLHQQTYLAPSELAPSELAPSELAPSELTPSRGMSFGVVKGVEKGKRKEKEEKTPSSLSLTSD